MANTIKLKRASGSDPSASDLSVGELAIRTSNCKLFSKNDGGSAIGIVAGSADTLTTARTIAGVSFDGSANISLNNNAITNGAGYLADIVSDSSPQLGADLDVQSNKITTATSNGNVKIEPNGTGVVEVRGAGGNDGKLQLNCSAQSHGIKLASPAHSAGQSYTLIFPDNQIAADKYLKIKSISGSGSTAIGQAEYASLDANDLGEGTIPDARFPSTLPSGVSVSSANIVDGTIVNADINASAAIQGSKISPDFGSQNIASSDITITSTSPKIAFVDSNNDSDFKIKVESGVFNIRDDTNSADRLSIDSSGRVGINETSASSFNSIADDLVISQASGSAGITIRSGTTSQGNISFQDAANTSFRGAVRYDHDGDKLQFITAGDIRTTIDSSGDVLIGTTTASVNGGKALMIADSSGGRIKLCDSDLGVGDNDGFEILASNNGTAYVWNRENTELIFGTNNDQRAVITAAGNFGIATTTPLRPLSIGTYGTGNAEIAFGSATDGVASLLFGDGSSGTDVYRGYVQYNHSSDSLLLATAATSRLTIDSSGNTKIIGNLNLDDNYIAKFGTGGDLEILHDGSHSRIRDVGTGILSLQSNDLRIHNVAATEYMARFVENAQVELYYDNNKKAETVSGGFTVTGTCTATAFSGDGSALTGIAAGATGGGSDQIFYENGQTVTTDYTITNGKNAMSAGPITINSGVTVTVGSGETLTIV